MDRIAHADDVYVANGAEAIHLHMDRVLRDQSPRVDLPPMPPLPTETAGDSAVVHAYINDARWLVTCPNCNGSQIVSKSDHRFLCWECKNFAVGFRWRPVAFPDNADAIETELLSWPLVGVSDQPIARRWVPGETLADLQQRKLDQLRPSVPRLEDLPEAVAEKVTASLANPDRRKHPEVTWDDDERTVPLVKIAGRKVEGLT